MAKKKSATKARRGKTGKKSARRVKTSPKRKAKAGPAAKKRVPAKKLARKSKASSKKSVRKSAQRKRAVATGKTTGKKVVASKTATARKKATKRTRVPKTSPASVTSDNFSVIRIKTNVKPKRRPAGNRKSRASQSPEATAHDPIQYPEESRRVTKTHLSAKDLREFRTLLLHKRAELCSDVERLSTETFRKNGGRSDHANMPIHMADLGSDNWEQDFALDLIDNERSRVVEIDDALRRIEKKTYGVCLATHKKISHARLRAKPWAKYCIEFARAREEGRAY